MHTKIEGRNKLIYLIGDRVRLQNVKTKDFLLTGTVVGLRETDDHRVLSYDIQTDLGYETTRHRRFLRPLYKEDKQATSADCSSNHTAADPPLTRQKARESNQHLPLELPVSPMKKNMSLRRSNRNKQSVQSTELHDQISTSLNLEKLL